MNRKKWHSVTDCLPEIEEEDFGIIRSRKVLIYAGGSQFIGYLEQFDDKEEPAEWKLIGRDNYTINNVTHWMSLPESPYEE
jgi:hypothetical protein